MRVMKKGEPMRRIDIALLGLCLALAPICRSAPAGGQEPSSLPLPATPAPAECTVAPRSIDGLRRLAEEGGAVAQESPTMDHEATPFEPLPGESADPAVAAAATSTIREFIACTNGGNYLASYALVTDDSIRRGFVEGRITLDASGGVDRLLEGPGFATPLPTATPDLRTALVAVHDVKVLADGRVGAVVELAVPPAVGGQGTREDQFLLREVDGRYLIDDQVVDIRGEGLLGSGAAPDGTPTTKAPR